SVSTKMPPLARHGLTIFQPVPHLPCQWPGRYRLAHLCRPETGHCPRSIARVACRVQPLEVRTPLLPETHFQKTPPSTGGGKHRPIDTALAFPRPEESKEKTGLAAFPLRLLQWPAASGPVRLLRGGLQVFY